VCVCALACMQIYISYTYVHVHAHVHDTYRTRRRFLLCARGFLLCMKMVKTQCKTKLPFEGCISIYLPVGFLCILPPAHSSHPPFHKPGSNRERGGKKRWANAFIQKGLCDDTVPSNSRHTTRRERMSGKGSASPARWTRNPHTSDEAIRVRANDQGTKGTTKARSFTSAPPFTLVVLFSPYSVELLPSTSDFQLQRGPYSYFVQVYHLCLNRSCPVQLNSRKVKNHTVKFSALMFHSHCP
jgi:hypothetical protein